MFLEFVEKYYESYNRPERHSELSRFVKLIPEGFIEEFVQKEADVSLDYFPTPIIVI